MLAALAMLYVSDGALAQLVPGSAQPGREREQHTQLGWGLVNPARALAMVDERKRQRGTASTAPIQR